ncbi:unnamed protein product [Vicia faba]|uniref:Uncharacterized protein n=1 Tax=Vicia faba TaxID=3906 RepID=A0AAV1AH43_VICFA|nr:unnamed protein product [Vicia faba]
MGAGFDIEDVGFLNPWDEEMGSLADWLVRWDPRLQITIKKFRGVQTFAEVVVNRRKTNVANKAGWEGERVELTYQSSGEDIVRVGKYICADRSTLKEDYLDVARVMVRTLSTEVLNERFNVYVDRSMFRLKMVEGTRGPLRLALDLKSDKEERIVSDGVVKGIFDDKCEVPRMAEDKAACRVLLMKHWE